MAFGNFIVSFLHNRKKIPAMGVENKMMEGNTLEFPFPPIYLYGT